MTTNELERQLRGALRETLDGELGPDRVWAESPAARRVAELGRGRRRLPLRVLAVAALVGTAGGAVLLAGAPRQPVAASNGWVAYTVFREDPAGGDPDTDIWFTAPDQQPRRVIGTDTDTVDQACPAFSPDGHSLAYGKVEGLWSTMNAATAQRPAYRNAALVIADVAEDGTISERRIIDVGDGLPPPCPVWSPDGRRLAFGASLTSPINPERSGEASEVWVVRLADGEITSIPDLLATDLDWSPDGSILAIAGGVRTTKGGWVVDARIHLYELPSGTLRTLADTLGVGELTWSPVGPHIAYTSGQSATGLAPGPRLRVIDVETGNQEVLTAAYSAIHGIGPVWSPDGRTIAYQRRVGGAERHEVVLVTPDDRSAETGLANEVVLPQTRTTADGSSVELWPWRVSWSPDGRQLLYVAWTFPNGCCGVGTVEETLAVAVPTDPDAPAVILAGNVLAYESDDTMRVPFQIWGRR